MPDIRMPDGTIIRNVPEGTTREQLMRRYNSARPKSGLEQAWDATKNVVAGGVEGALSIPDMVWDGATGVRRMANSAVGSGGAAALRAVGAGGAADWWERGSQGVERDLSRMSRPSSPVTNAAPVPSDTAGKAARFGAQLLGGLAVPIPSPAKPPRMPSPRAAPKGVNLDVVQAGQRQRIPIRRPDAVPAARGAMAHAKSAPYSAPVVARAMDADNAALQARLAEIGGPGNVQTETYNLGQQIQKVGTDFIKRTGKVKNNLYATAEELAAGQRVSPKTAIAEIDRNIAELTAAGANSNKSTIAYLQGLKQDLAKPNGFSITEFQGLRSAARNAIKGSQELTATDAERRLGSVVRAFSDDARTQLPQPAAKALDEADAYYAQRMGTIKDVLQKHVLGKKSNPTSPERAAQNLTAIAKNRANYDAFSRFWDISDPQTKADFAASFANRLGVGRNGQFGPGLLRTDIENVPQNISETIFGKEGAMSLDDLRTIAGAKSDTLGGLNSSKASDVLLRQVAPRVAGATLLGSLAGGPVGAVVAPVATEGAAALSQLRSARSLLNPDFSKYLAQQAPQSGDLLSKILVGDSAPALNAASNDIGGLLSSPYLAQAVSEDTKKKKKHKR